MKQGDVIELENGDVMLVTLTKIGSNKITDLKVNSRYRLKYSGMYCFITNIGNERKSDEDLHKILNSADWIFVGCIDPTHGGNVKDRNVFYADGRYIMFDAARIDYVVYELN